MISNLFWTCQPQSTSQIDLSFYHWKGQFQLSQSELDYLDTLSIQKLYLRCFDIDWDFSQQQAVPLATLDLHSPLPKGMQIIPTLFITNRTFLHLPEANLSDLVDKTYQKINHYIQQFPAHSIPEIQLDCDWSGQTRVSYFRFLNEIKAKFTDIPISATIRLHQIKYFEKTGVPPVDRGILMFYNMGKVEDWDSKNSILDLDIAQTYLEGFDRYPLNLDLALPIFSWGVLFRDGKMIRLINAINTHELSDAARFVKVGKNRFEVVKSTYLDGQYLYRGDAIRVEQIHLDDLRQSLQLLHKKWKPMDRSLVFYHLDSAIIKSYPHEDIQQLLPLFSD